MIKKKIAAYTLFCFLCLGIFLFISLTPGIPKSGPYSNGEVINVKGFLHLVGSEPFPQFILRTNVIDGETNKKIDFILPDNFRQKYRKYINLKVELKGKVKIKILERADHKFKIKQFYLNSPVLLTVY